MNRKPVVAGSFYPGAKSSLEKDLRRLLNTDAAPRKALAVVAPHAGYVYSGKVAGATFASAMIPKRCIVLCPNHTGMGREASVWTGGGWEIPTGVVSVDEELARKLISKTPELADDSSAHLKEHSLEVELPFLLARQPEISIVAIALSHLSVGSCKKIGEAIAEVISEAGEEILIVASSDMNHYESQTKTLEKDRLAIDRVLSLDAEGLLSVCGENRISMCGAVPTAVAIIASKKLGANKASLVGHSTSGDVSGDYDSVVGYAGFLIEREGL
ncbi:MAG TPA: AmmeMemoRadiSam system protein B [bacterium]|nr:AmmeMemoRadiSam system protein B [bacterium]